jgi:Mn-dependent DtxR family transcriptional regulator
MMTDANREFVEDMSESDKIVLLTIANSGTIKSTRLQKIALMIKAVLDGKVESSHGAYLFDGFSDDIDESVNSLRSEGFLIYEHGTGYKVSNDGMKLSQTLSSKENQLENKVNDVIKMLKDLSDKQVTALTYRLFPQMTENSIIKEEMNRIGNDMIVTSFDIDKIRHGPKVDIKKEN